MQFNIIESLTWDSCFFGYPVARITLDQNGKDNLDDLFQQLKSKLVRVTYIFVAPEEKEIIDCITKKGSILVDQKTLFSKMTKKHDKSHSSIYEFHGQKINDRLIDLALQAGLYSRFHTDGNFINNEFEKLYIEWVTQLIKGKKAFKILIAKKGSKIVGMTTIGESTCIADIGLVAVDIKYRGQGIGHDLIQASDTAAFERGLKEIKVATQLKNKEACRLYEKCNFHIEKITNIYHYWQK